MKNYEFTPEEIQWLVNHLGDVPTKYGNQPFNFLTQKVKEYHEKAKAAEEVKPASQKPIAKPRRKEK